MQNGFTRTAQRHTGRKNLFNFEYQGVKYKVNFFREDNEDNGWFCDLSNEAGSYEFYAAPDEIHLCNFETLDSFIKLVERLARENKLHILPASE